uniref:THAP-type domain-containing protein n=1 Tax=Panagrellus redivivus TaxID=6233 RepID=A0A7E4VCJ6_PANRE
MISIWCVAMVSISKDSPCRKHWPSIKRKLKCKPSEPNPNPVPIRDYFKFPRYICESIQLYWRTIHERFQQGSGIISARLRHYRDRMTFYTRKVFTRKPNVYSTTPAPEIRIVESIVYRDCDGHHDAPPTYRTAMYSEPPNYEIAVNPAAPPKYID